MSRCDELQKHLQEAETLIRDRKEKRRSVLLAEAEAEAEEAQQRPAPAAVRCHGLCLETADFTFAELSL